MPVITSLKLNPEQTEQVEQCHPLAERLSRGMFNRPGRRQWLDEAYNTAIDGLLRAARTYDPVIAGQFDTFASSVIRLALRGLLSRKLMLAAKRPRQFRYAVDDRGEVLDPIEPCRPISCVLPDEWLEGLPTRQAEVLRLRFVDDRNFREIGHCMGITKACAFKLLKRALASVRKNIPADLAV